MKLIRLILEAIGLILRTIGSYLLGFGCGLAVIAFTVLVFAAGLWGVCLAIVHI